MRIVTKRGKAMSSRLTYSWVIVIAIMLTVITVFMYTCDAAELDRRPCRATSRRLYEELQGSADEVDGGVGNANSEYGGGDAGSERIYQEPEDQETTVDDDYSSLPPPSPVYEKPRRGVRRLTSPVSQKQYEKKFERTPYSGVVAASGNSLRATDTALLRGETIELPTYVNVPVTLRCRFVPLDGMDNKFETVVESMYPGHADAPPPPTDSHASQVIRQLMGSVDGWRSAINKSTRPVRRVIETRFGWPRTWSMDSGGGTGVYDGQQKESRSGERNDGGRDRRGRRPYAEDATSRQIAARRQAAERQQWFHGSPPNARLDTRRRFSDRWPTARGQGSRERENGRLTENELIEDRVSERIDDQQRDEQIDDQPQQMGQDDLQSADQIQHQTLERAEYSQLEPVDGGETEKPVIDQREEGLSDRMVDDRTAEDMVVEDYPAVDRPAEEVVDDRRVLGEESVNEFQLPEVTAEPEIVTTAQSDYATLTPSTWIKTFKEDAIPA